MLLAYRSTNRKGRIYEKYSHEITRETVNRHLKDINDTISEEDIRLVDTSKLPIANLEEEDENMPG